MTKRIIVLGGGPAGLACAIRLTHTLPGTKITLIDKKPYHLIRSELYRFLVEHKKQKNYVLPISSIIRGLPIEFIEDQVKHINPLSRTVELFRNDKFVYDFLVIALGNVPNIQKIPGLSDHGWRFNNIVDANHLKQELKVRLSEKRQVHLVISGGGVSGTELAAALRSQYPGDRLTISIIEQNSRILPGISHLITEGVYNQLKKDHIHTYTSQSIKKVTDKSIHLSNLHVPYDILIWTGGYRGNPIVEKAGLDCNTDGFARVNRFLQARGYSNVFIIGDSADIRADGKVTPRLASSASDQGILTAQNIARQAQSKPLVAYKPHNYPLIITLDKKFGALEYGNLVTISPIVIKFKAILLFNYLRKITSTRTSYNFAFTRNTALKD